MKRLGSSVVIIMLLLAACGDQPHQPPRPAPTAAWTPAPTPVSPDVLFCQRYALAPIPGIACWVALESVNLTCSALREGWLTGQGVENSININVSPENRFMFRLMMAQGIETLCPDQWDKMPQHGGTEPSAAAT